VIFGSSGNLARTRIIPAVRRLRSDGLLPDHYSVLGVDRKPAEGGGHVRGYRFLRGDFRSRSTFSALGRLVRARTRRSGSAVIFYLATRPELFPGIVSRLEEEGLSRSKLGRRSIMVEKPFGADLRSARVLERRLRSAFPPRDIFRVDHFLAKAGTERIRQARFDSSALRPVWNRRFIDHVQIMADEGVDVGARGAFYDSTGVVRDMIQNHLLQLLCLVAMETPTSPSPAEVARSKACVLRAMRMPSAEEVVLGQYGGYAQTIGVRRDSSTPTFAAIRVGVDNARWRGVPFYLRTGKALARTATEVVVVFRDPVLPSKGASCGLASITFCIDPSADVIVEPRGEARAAPSEGPRKAEDEYESLLLEALDGSQELFVDGRFNMLSWKVLAPLLTLEKTRSPRPAPYEPGTWGPSAADRLIADDGRSWRDGRG